MLHGRNSTACCGERGVWRRGSALWSATPTEGARQFAERPVAGSSACMNVLFGMICFLHPPHVKHLRVWGCGGTGRLVENFCACKNTHADVSGRG